MDYSNKRQKFYKTGDLCMIDEDGDLLYYGRLNHQVKIQGYRIELGEIEFHAREAIGGKNAIAFVYNDEGGNKQIALSLETDGFDKKEVVRYLNTKLPAYMLPFKLYTVEKFPLNTSNKIDRQQVITLMPK